MWKYKKALYCGIGAGLLYSFYVVIYIISSANEIYHISHIIMRTYTYHFFFSLLLFGNLYKTNHTPLMMHRFKTIRQYQKMMFLSDLINTMIYFVTAVIMQILVNVLFVKDTNMLTLIYQNFIMLMISGIFVYLNNYIIVKKRMLLLILMLLFWNLEMVIYLVFSGSFLAVWNIFAILMHVDLVIILQYISLVLMIICITQYMFGNKRRGVKSWLE